MTQTQACNLTQYHMIGQLLCTALAAACLCSLAQCVPAYCGTSVCTAVTWQRTYSSMAILHNHSAAERTRSTAYNGIASTCVTAARNTLRSSTSAVVTFVGPTTRCRHFLRPRLCFTLDKKMSLAA